MLDSSKSMKTMEFDSTKEIMSKVISNLRPSTEGESNCSRASNNLTYYLIVDVPIINRKCKLR